MVETVFTATIDYMTPTISSILFKIVDEL